MKKKISQEINEIRRDYNRLKDTVYDDMKELYEDNGFLKDKVDAIYDAHRRNTILFLAFLMIAFVCHLYSFRQHH